ncbi:YggU family protein [Candidatus Woesearchaeota archaeon]|nr:YggU family protein [Candidatus Woesearchaeota archaeon]
MSIEQYIKNNTLSILVKPNSSKTEILGWDEEKQALRIAIHAPPEDNKANKELLKFLKKTLKRKVELIKGKTSREKVVRIS